MEKVPQTVNIPSIAIENVKDTEAILSRVKSIKDALVLKPNEDAPVENIQPRCVKDLLEQESYILHEIMGVISEIEKELL